MRRELGATHNGGWGGANRSSSWETVARQTACRHFLTSVPELSGAALSSTDRKERQRQTDREREVEKERESDSRGQQEAGRNRQRRYGDSSATKHRRQREERHAGHWKVASMCRFYHHPKKKSYTNVFFRSAKKKNHTHKPAILMSLIDWAQPCSGHKLCNLLAPPFKDPP